MPSSPMFDHFLWIYFGFSLDIDPNMSSCYVAGTKKSPSAPQALPTYPFMDEAYAQNYWPPIAQDSFRQPLGSSLQ